MRNPTAHILICRTDNIGDVVLTLPLAGYLKSQYPGIKISFLCRTYAAPVVRHCSFVDQVIALEALDASEALEALDGPQRFFEQAAIDGISIDTIIFAFPVRRLAIAAKKARIKNRIGTSHRLFHWFTCNRLAHFSRVKSGLHEAQLNFALLRPLGLNDIPALSEIPALYGLTAPAHAATGEVAPVRFNVILHPKSNGNGREWPIGHYTQLAQLLLAHRDIGFWITGSAAEGDALAHSAVLLLALPNVENLCGKVDLDGLTSLIGMCDGLVASGTGPLHLAAALGRPTLGLFPPVKPIDPARWGALGAQAQSLCQSGQCGQNGQCSQSGGCNDAASCVCMQNIRPEQVAGVILQWREDKALAKTPAAQKHFNPG
jgi:ADP-heptose:LPS heptosyltransferase